MLKRQEVIAQPALTRPIIHTEFAGKSAECVFAVRKPSDPLHSFL